MGVKEKEGGRKKTKKKGKQAVGTLARFKEGK